MPVPKSVRFVTLHLSAPTALLYTECTLEQVQTDRAKHKAFLIDDVYIIMRFGIISAMEGQSDESNGRSRRRGKATSH